MESKKINQLATELTPALSDLTIIGDPTTGISKKITLSQMASLFTGTVEEYANLASFPLVGVADTIYIALDTNVLYRWDTGLTSYVELSPNIINSLVFSDANGFDGTISLVGSVATLTITTALTTGSVGFIGASGALLQDNANFFWDDTNNRLGIGTNAPTTAIDTFGSGIITRVNGTSTNNAFIGFASAGTNKWSVGNVQSDHRFRIYSEANTSELVSVLQTGEFGIGIANPTTKLHIDGGASALIANLDANVSVAKSISFRSDNSNRINLEVSGTESGSNVGADLFIRTYTDLGALIETPFQITRSTGLTTIKSLTLTNALSIANGGTGSTTQNFVDLTTAQTVGGIKSFSSNIIVRSGNEIRFNRADNAIYTRLYDAGSGSANGFILDNTNGEGFHFKNGSTTIMRMPSNHFVGIGLDAPAYKLDVRGLYDAGGIITVRSTDSAAIDKGGVLGFGGFHNGSSNQSQWAYIKGAKENSNVNDNASYLSFGTQLTASSMVERLRITSGGNVIIQRPASGATLLQLSGSSAYGDTSTINLCDGRSYIKSEILVSANGNTDLRFGTYDGSSISERMRILPSGTNFSDVVIGTTTTSYGGNAGRGTLTVGGSNTALYSLQIGGVNRAYLYCDSTATYLDNASGTGDIVVVNGTGGVKLTRNATSWVSNSDERLKNINSTIENAIEKLLTLRTVNFSWKSDDTNAENIGLIAQDVEKVLPQLIHKSKLVSKIDEENTDQTEYLGVRYTELIPVLVKAIQELNAKIK